MEWRAAQGAANDRPVSIEVSRGEVAERDTSPPEACIVAVAPLEGPWLADRIRPALLRLTRFKNQPSGVEYLRLSSRNVAQALAGLDNPSGPSLLRDAAAAVLAAGVPSIDLVVAHVEGAKPWDYHHPDVRDAVEPYLEELPGAMLLFPDFHGPHSIGPGFQIDEGEFTDRLRATLDVWGPHLVDRYQIALLDMPRLSGGATERLLETALGHDIALCRWRGHERDLRAHGWRSGAAHLLGLLLAPGTQPILGINGRHIPLSGGRAINYGRQDLLRVREPDLPVDPLGHLLLNLELDGDTARVTNEATFRRPLGTWPLSALRVVKAVHQTLMQTASRFVFKPANGRQAMALAAALQHSMMPFVSAGLLEGPDGSAIPLVGGTVERVTGTGHSLVADVQGIMKPWSQNVTVRISLRPQSPPSLEVS